MTTAVPWPSADPAQAGFDPGMPARLDAALAGGALDGLHAILVLRHGCLVVERYVAGPDWTWNRPLGIVRHGPGTLHDIRSVTKSVVALLYGIALDRGLVPPPETPLLDAIDGYRDLAADPERRRLTIDHALTMTLGLAWDESAPYDDPANDEIAMERAPDRVRFVLERPVVEAPGRRWIYSGGASALVGRILTDGTGLSLPAFAREALFDPLGIGETQWMAGRPGEHSAAAGLRMTARDLARLGELVRVGGSGIVSSAWLGRQATRAVATDWGADYARHWFVGAHPTGASPDAPLAYQAGFGLGGQRLWIMPAAGLTVAILAGNYQALDQWVAPLRVWSEIVLPALRGP
jgi:CubicO group peptidase (beta-lactamase class C family)